jgi:hypothetical protein
MLTIAANDTDRLNPPASSDGLRSPGLVGRWPTVSPIAQCAGCDRQRLGHHDLGGALASGTPHPDPWWPGSHPIGVTSAARRAAGTVRTGNRHDVRVVVWASYIAPCSTCQSGGRPSWAVWADRTAPDPPPPPRRNPSHLTPYRSAAHQASAQLPPQDPPSGQHHERARDPTTEPVEFSGPIAGDPRPTPRRSNLVADQAIPGDIRLELGECHDAAATNRTARGSTRTGLPR